MPLPCHTRLSCVLSLSDSEMKPGKAWPINVYQWFLDILLGDWFFFCGLNWDGEHKYLATCFQGSKPRTSFLFSFPLSLNLRQVQYASPRLSGRACCAWKRCSGASALTWAGQLFGSCDSYRCIGNMLMRISWDHSNQQYLIVFSLVVSSSDDFGSCFRNILRTCLCAGGDHNWREQPS